MLEIKTVNKGAELVSVKLDGIEKIHNGESFWNRHAPVLFPIVGKLKDNKTVINGEEYGMTQHGFARDMEFKKISENAYVLASTEETLNKFPFKFELYISYEVVDNELTTKYKVVNKDNKEMIFGLGGHPAFVCDYSNENSYIELSFGDETQIFQLEDGLVKVEPEKKEKFISENKLYLNKDTFENDAIIFKNLKERKAVLISNNKKVLEFNFEDFKHLGVWSKVGAPFVCIEPWLNTADRVNSSGKLIEKEDIVKLDPNETIEAKYSVKFS